MADLIAKNPYYVTNDGGEDFVIFTTGGKTKVDVKVDLQAWEQYLHQYHWTVIQKGNLVEIKATRNNQSKNIARIIAEMEFDEIDYFGRSVDHINHDRCDNRIKNLRLCSAKENANNISSTQEAEGMEMIFPQPGGRWKVHTKVFDETIYKHFQTLEEAKLYRDTEVKPYIERRKKDLEKKTRDVEFERGLRSKLGNGEREEVLDILRRYQII